MPRLSEAAYAQHYPCVVKLAKRKGGVSRPEIMKELSLSRVMADSLIDRCKLRKSKRKVGRTEFFHTSRGTSAILEEAVNASPEKPAAKAAKKAKAAQKNGTPKAAKIKADKPKVASKPSDKSADVAPISYFEKTIKEMADRAGRGLSEFIICRAKAEAAGDALRQSLQSTSV